MPNAQDTEFPPYLKIDVGEHVPAIRTGVLFRSGWGIAPGLPVAVNDPLWKIDMRGRKHITPEELAVDHSRITVIAVEQPSGTPVLATDATRADYTANYVGMLQHCSTALAQVVQATAECLDDGGCVLGCSLGRDRTGVVLALIQRGLGASLPDILAAEARMRTEVARLVAISPHTFRGMTREQALTRLHSAHEPVVDSIDVCERQWGSVRDYLAAHGIDPGVWPRLARAVLY